MKKNKVYIAAIVMFLFASCFIFWRYEVRVQKKQRTQFGLLERKGNLANIAEWASIKTSAAAMLKKITENPSDKKSLLTLTAIYLQEARISGNYAYYDAAAIKLVNNILKIDPENFEALTFKAMIQMSQHHFAEGLAIAEKAKQINPYNAFVYGLLVDGNVEMGNYDAAVKNCDKMISIRPDIRSYSRVSYLREIYGDLQGAIEAMKMAVDAGPPGDENTEWSRVQLGKLYESTGNADSAEYEYQISLQLRPGYAFALAGLGRVYAHKNDFRHAVDAYKQAVAFVDDFGIKEELAELYESMGKKDSATILFQQNIDQMAEAAEASAKYDSVGHYADREMAYAWLKINNFDKALDHAFMEYNRRPQNIDVNEVVAWSYYKKGEFAKALPHIESALKTHCKNPTLLCRAGLIYSKSGDLAKSKILLGEALEKYPLIPFSLKTEALAALSQQ